jgi:hypothetical protein
MIVLSLQCADSHSFEGWFASTGAFDDQARTDMVACPMCGTTSVSRLPSGPRVKRSTDSSALPSLMAHEAYRAISDMVRKSENVGEKFPEEARRMHYGEVEARNIRGHATLSEARELIDEGISVMPVPVVPLEETH